MSTVSSNNQLESLNTSEIGVTAQYAFHNPDSVNGPFGTMDLTISADGDASGTVQINTLFGLGSVTNLTFTGTADFNGSTGYTTIDTVGHGTIIVRPNPPRHISAAIAISLEPGFQRGTMSVEGFFTNFTIIATSINR